jgi:glycolate oxidase
LIGPYSHVSEEIYQRLENIVGNEFISRDPEIVWCYSFDGTIFKENTVPEIVILPKKTIEIAKILKIANDNKIIVVPRGSGTSLAGGPISIFGGGIILDLSKMNRIISIDIPNNLTIVEPGVICDDLNFELNKFGYFFPPDPASSCICTIGGMVANNSGGVQAFKYGVTKDYIMFLEIVLPDGRVINTGSSVRKSVSSYNFNGLFVGSEGTLGIITKIGLKIIPLPQARKMALFIFDTIESISQAVIELRKKGITPNLLEFMDEITTKASFEYLGGEYLLFPHGIVLLAEVDGNKIQVQSDFSKLFHIIMKFDPKFYKIADSEEERENLLDARKSALPALSRIKPSCCIEDCTVSIDKFAECVNSIKKISKELNLDNIEIANFGHMDGNMHPTFLFNENNKNDRKSLTKAMNYLYKEIIIPLGGTITGEHGVGSVKTPFLNLEYDRNTLTLMRELKLFFDPKMILNPGKGKGDPRIIDTDNINRSLKITGELALSCMRCGFCIPLCPSKDYYNFEAYTPRGRLSILNGLVHGDLKLSKKINEILHACILCGACTVLCPAGVKTSDIFEKARELIHKNRMIKN